MKARSFIVLSFLFLLSFKSANSFAQDLLVYRFSENEVRRALVLEQKWVPYPAYSDREAWVAFFGENRKRVIQRGESKLNYQWQLVKATDYLEYERSGNRKVMENGHTANQNALSDLVLAELAEGEGRFLDQIINAVFLQCERTSWVLSAHLPAQRSKRTLPEHEDVVIDLGSARLAGLLAWTHYFFKDEFDQINPEISKRLRKELYDKMITPYRNETRYWWMAFDLKPGQLVNNWNPWCNFNALQCALLLEDDPDLLAHDIYKTMLSVDQFINYIQPDGACEEGPSYWGHAAGKLYDYLRVLEMGTGGLISLFEEPMIKKMGEYMPDTYVGNNWVVNFADASAHFSADAALIYRYGKAVSSDYMMNFAAQLIQKEGKNSLTFGVDLFRALESFAYDKEIRNKKAHFAKKEAVIYPQTQFYYFSTKSDFFLATKGGNNNESHNHNDVGTFSLYYKQTPFFIDAGVGTYTRQTFGPERYSIWTMRSLYHNLPVINGQEQKHGGQFRATAISVNPKSKKVSMNLAGAYPKEAHIKHWQRSYHLKSQALWIEDDFELTQNNKHTQIHFMLWGSIDVSQAGKVSISNQENTLFFEYDKSLLRVELEDIELDDPRLTKVWGDKIYRLILIPKESSIKGKYKYKISTN